MKVASFDIGIKNLAVFVGVHTEPLIQNELSNEDQDKKTKKEIGIKPLFWKVINILGEDTRQCCKCGNKAIVSEIDNDECISWYCKVHDPNKKSRTEQEYKSLLLKRDGKKVGSCGTQELQVKMLQSLDDCVENLYNLLDVDIVLIELQPKLNPKMKQLSHTLYTWFLMRGVMPPNSRIKEVKFIAAKNKLKVASMFCPLLETDEEKLKGKYNQRKYLAQAFTREISSGSFEKEFIDVFENSSKKDDLSDCFLQCLFYFNSKEIKETNKKQKCLKSKPRNKRSKTKSKKN